MKYCDLPPDAPSMMWSTRAIGYTTEAAVADLIDNSITAGAGTIEIEFASCENDYVSVLDDGAGMSREELMQAMKYGSTSPLTERSELDLGRFGLGLKTASLSQCKELTVISKKDDAVSAFRWDLDFVMNTAKKWLLQDLEDDEILDIPQIDKLRERKEGTLVLWRKLDKIYAGQDDRELGLQETLGTVMEHLSLTFHRYLAGEQGLRKLKIVCNGNVLEPTDPFYISRSTCMFPETVPVSFDRNGTDVQAEITITPYILPFPEKLTQHEINLLKGRDDLTKNQGFYIYRNKRLIVPANWFRLARKTDLTKLCRVKVDIPNTMDEDWMLDIKKSVAKPPDIVLKALKRIINKILDNGKRTYRFRARKETNSDIKPWTRAETRNGIIYEVNRDYPLIKDLRTNSPDGKLEIALKLIEQNIPLNSIHSDFHDDKKFANEDCAIAERYVLKNLHELLLTAAEEDRKDVFEMLMKTHPFSEYEISLEEALAYNG